MRKLIKHIQEEWYRYLLEILVLIVGIYGAFALESWNEARKERIIELEILEGCVTELSSDLNDIELNISLHEKANNSMTEILDVIQRDVPYHDSLAYDFGYAMIYTFFLHSTSSFEAMKSRGIEIISNKVLRDEIIGVYDANYSFFYKVEQDLVSDVLYGYRNIFNSRFEETYNIDEGSTDFRNRIVPLDFESLKNDKEFLFYLKTLRNKTRFVLGYHYAQLRNNVIQLRTNLEAEIERKQ